MVRHDDWGVADGWWATDGTWRDVDPRTRTVLHTAQGADGHPDGPPPGPPMWFVTHGEAPELWSPATVALDGGGEVEVDRHLPHDLPLGVHQLQPADGGPATTLFVLAARAPRPRRGWGWSAQLYSARSGDSWGHGDLADLADLARWASDGGAELLAHNPLGAALPTAHQQPSPYYASSRRFLSPLYLRVEQVDGATGADATAVVQRAAAAGRALNEQPWIDRDQVWALKIAAMEAIWTEIRERDTTRATLAEADDDVELLRFATFCALAEHHGGGWDTWPAELRHPDDPAVAEFAAAHRDRVELHRWMQLQAAAQLDRAASAGAGLMADLPVGFDPSGFDAWIDQDLLALGCSIGAPPDDFSPTGQDWGLPPYVPWKLRGAAYGPWVRTLRRIFAHCDALRVDHVMGLFRLFWIPGGDDARSGGYVYHRGDELLALAVTEAARAGAVLVGEDLGTVEPHVREAMIDRDVFGYRIGWFADEPPEQWPSTTLASLTTHDLPTVAGLWSGQDASDRAAAGVAEDPEGDALLRARLARLAQVDDDASEHDVVLGAHRALAASASDVAVATLEDAVGERSRPNLPGTVDEHPNWRRALRVPIEQLDDAGAAEIAAVMADRRPR
jgi:4-alpha-glucanotransferase